MEPLLLHLSVWMMAGLATGWLVSAYERSRSR
jgi:hypothetical protein